MWFLILLALTVQALADEVVDVKKFNNQKYDVTKRIDVQVTKAQIFKIQEEVNDYMHVMAGYQQQIADWQRIVDAKNAEISALQSELNLAKDQGVEAAIAAEAVP